MRQPWQTDNKWNHLEAIQAAIMAAADPVEVVRRNLALQTDCLRIGTQDVALQEGGRIYLVGIGKAALTMSMAAMAQLGERVHQGVVTCLAGVKTPAFPQLQFITAGHPLPTEGSLAAGTAIESMLSGTGPQDVVLVLISGGGSAMVELPRAEIQLDDLQHVNRLLLTSGAPIQEMNRVRRALSRFKAGGLARLAAPAQTHTLILSDVIGDQLSAIASGPTVLRPVSLANALKVLETYGIAASIPESVRNVLTGPEAVHVRARRPYNRVIGSNKQALQAAADAAHELGFRTRILNARLTGEAREAGVRIATGMLKGKGPLCLLMGGETTVSVHGKGKGGRSQELALAAALALDGAAHCALMAYATDGIDGPTDSAGARIDGNTVTRIRAAGRNPRADLRANDAYHALAAADALIYTGPTGTNVNDVIVGLVYATRVE